MAKNKVAPFFRTRCRATKTADCHNNTRIALQI